MYWRPDYIILILIVTFISYFAGLKIGGSAIKIRRKKYLILSSVGIISVLFVFKYSNFVLEIINGIFPENQIFNNFRINLLLPIGISFYTFQALSYIIEVYRGNQIPEKKFGIYAVFISFFPQLVAGPIEKSTHLLPQLYKKIIFDYERVSSGARLMLWGFFKKIVIADNAAVVVDKVFNNVNSFTEGSYFIIATFLFSFQIYCDFSGYSDIAIGAARMLGINLVKNFDRPYHAKSISEFWRRWHISLSVWLRDYLFLPVSYWILRKTGRIEIKIINSANFAYISGIIITMFLGGLWHGAKWTFVLWGSILGFFMVFGRITKKYRNHFLRKLNIKKKSLFYKIIRIFITFSLINFSWIFFRANSINDAFYILKCLFNGVGVLMEEIIGRFLFHLEFDSLLIVLSRLGISPFRFSTIVFGITILFFVQLLQRKNKIAGLFKDLPVYVRWTVYYSLIFFIIYSGNFKIQKFIYFQF